MSKKDQGSMKEGEDSEEVLSTLEARRRERYQGPWTRRHSIESAFAMEPPFEDGESWKI